MAVVRVHHYSVDEADYEEFRKRRAAVIDAMRADHPGLSKTTLIKLEDGTYTDTWRWDSAAQMGAAFGAAATVAEIGPAMSLTRDGTAVNGEIIDEQ
jgi:DNA-binding XRE family transcriptional regulator